MKNPDIITALTPVIQAFNKLGILYYISGSVASSVYGIARATLDVDMVSNLTPLQVKPLIKLLEKSYYIEEKMIESALRRHSSFNLIHLDTMLKIDIFILKQRDYDKSAFERKKIDTLDISEKTPKIYIASPEDIILSKLEWFEKGGEVSEKQWNDILGIFKVQQNLLDMKYLRHWASELKLTDLLKKAIEAAN